MPKRKSPLPLTPEENDKKGKFPNDEDLNTNTLKATSEESATEDQKDTFNNKKVNSTVTESEDITEYPEIEKDESSSKEKVSDRDDKEIYQVNVESKSAFSGDTSTYRLTVESSKGVLSDAQVFTTIAKEEICAILEKALEELECIKVVFNLHGSFVDNEYNDFDNNDTVIIESVENLNSDIQLAFDTIIRDFNTDIEGTKQILNLNVHIHKNKIETSSYLPLPSYISERNVVNVRSADHASFKWAVLAAFHPEIYNPSDYTLSQFSDEFNLDGVELPVKLNDIPKIEERNDISFNIYISRFKSKTETEIRGPVYHTKNRRDRHINLLLLQDCGKWHYCYIRCLKALVDPENKGHICDGCLVYFDDLLSLKEHRNNDCFHAKAVMAVKSEKYADVGQGNELPITVYADFEAFLEDVSDDENGRKQETFVKNVSKHVPFSFGFYIKCSTNDELSCLRTYHGLDCDKEFLKLLKSSLEDVLKHLNEEIEFIPIFFHNFSRYDAHFLIKGLNSIEGYIGALGNKYNFIAIYKDININNKNVKLQFLDSIKFLSGSIESLAERLDRDKFIESRRFWRDLDQESFDLLTQKGTFPYQYVRSLEDLQKTTLPKKEEFYDSLKACHVSDEAYQRALKVWELFECQNLLDYSMLYLKTDVLLFADLFENFRNICLRTYELDPARYYSMSSLSWDAMLKKTEVELKPLTDISMLAFLKRAMRGGIAHCTRRHAVANNKYLPNYDENEKSSYLMYYDANNLYGWAMSQPLPYDGFEWVDVDVDFQVPVDSEVGYFLEVDLTYPDNEKIHDHHADFPFCPEKKKSSVIDGERLITDLTSKQKYVLHHSFLTQCVKHGLVLGKVHRVLKFKQKPWLKPYIDFNIKLRADATSISEKDFYKLMNNSIFGKTIQNTDKYTDVKIFDHWFNRGMRRGGYNMVENPEYHSHDLIGDNLVTVQLNKTKHNYKNPIYVGLSVLDLAKAHMYQFHYSFMKTHFGENLKLLYTDTDSFLYQIFTEDYYTDLKKIKNGLEDYFDTSEYPEDNQFGYPKLNKLKVGYFKDEFKGKVIKEFVALRPKVYMMEADGLDIKRAASAPNIVRDRFTLEDYKRCLFTQEPLFKEMHAIKAVGHDLYTQHIRKAVLKPTADTKRHMIDQIDSLPFGHYRLKQDLE